jgi:hypothetical protein
MVGVRELFSRFQAKNDISLFAYIPGILDRARDDVLL